MQIQKFGNLNEDVKIAVLDAVIDDNGLVYNGELDGVPVIKGNIELKKISGRNKLVGIIGDDGKRYPAGIDKNGELVCINGDEYAKKLDGETDIIINDRVKEAHPKELRIQRFKTNFDYSFMLSTKPTGWVNVKIDMEILKRVRRYSKGLGTESTPHDTLIRRLQELDKISQGIKSRQRKRETIQKQLSVIMLLHYINEIKGYFTPSSQGFLFESFIAGLIPDSKVKEDNSSVDITSRSESYQIKLYSSNTTSIPYSLGSGEVDYCIPCLKYPDRVDVYILSTDVDSDNYLGDFLTGSTNSGILVSRLLAFGEGYKYTFKLTNIEEKINKIATGLKEVLDLLYSELSQFQYNVETIITGVNTDGDLISDQEFAQKSADASVNIQSMQRELNSLVRIIGRQ